MVKTSSLSSRKKRKNSVAILGMLQGRNLLVLGSIKTTPFPKLKLEYIVDFVYHIYMKEKRKG